MGWAQLFGEGRSFVEWVHIPLHAVLKSLYLDYLQDPHRLERDIKDCERDENYTRAWQYVEENDYKEIIVKLRESYSALAN